MSISYLAYVILGYKVDGFPIVQKKERAFDHCFFDRSVIYHPDTGQALWTIRETHLGGYDFPDGIDDSGEIRKTVEGYTVIASPYGGGPTFIAWDYDSVEVYTSEAKFIPGWSGSIGPYGVEKEMEEKLKPILGEWESENFGIWLASIAY